MAAFTPVGVEFVARGMRDFESRINHVNDSVLELSDSIEKMGKKAAKNASDDFIELARTMDSAREDIGALGNAFGQQASGGGGLGSFLETAANLGSVIGGISGVVGGAITAVVDLGKAMIGAAIDGAQFLASELLKVISVSTEMAGSFESATKVLGIAASADIAQGVTSFEELSEAALAVGGDTRLIGVSAMQSAEAITGLYKAGLSTEDIFGDLEGYLEGNTDLMGALRAAIDLAAASELDMVQASDLAAVLLSTFGQQAKESGMAVSDWIVGAMNNMVQAADASVADVSDLTEALNNVGPIAASFGFSLEDVNTALAILSMRGIRGAEAGTVLRSMFSTMTGGGKKAEKAMKELGVSLYDQEGNMLGLSEIVGQLVGAMDGVKEVTYEVGGRTAEQNEELKRLRSMYAATAQDLRDYELGISGVGQTEEARQKSIEQLRLKMTNLGAAIEDLESIQGEAVTSTVALTDKQTNMYAKTLAGTYGMRGLTSILAEGTEGWDAMSVAIGDAATIQEVSAKRADSLAGVTEAYEGSMESLSIRIGQQFLPVATGFKRFMTDMVDTVGPRVVDMFTQLGSVVQRVADVFFGLDWGTILEDLLSGDVSSLFEGLSFAALELGVPEGVIDFVTNLIDKGTELVGWLQTTIPQAIATASSYWTDTLWPAMQSVWGWVNDTAIPIIESVWTWLQEAIPAAIESASDFWTTTLQPAIDSVVVAFGNLVAFWEEHGPAIQETAANVFEKFSEVSTALAQDIIPWVGEKLELISAWFEDNGPGIQAFIAALGEAWTWVAGVIGNAWSVIEPLLSGLIDIVLEIGTLMFTETGSWGAAWEAFTTFAENVLGIFIDGVGEAFGALADLVVQALGGESWAAVREQWAANWEMFTTIVSTIWTNIVSTVQDFIEMVRRRIMVWSAKVRRAWLVFWNGVSNKVTEVWDSITTFLSDAWTGIKDKATEIWDSITGFFSDTWAGVEETASGIWGSIASFFSDTWTGIEDGVTETWENITTALSDTWTGIEDKATEIWDGIRETVSGAVEGLFEAMGIDLDEMKERWSVIWEDIKAIAAEIWDRISSAVTERLTAMRDNAVELWEDVKASAAEIWEAVVSAVTERLEDMRAKAEEIWGTISTKAGEIWGDISSTVTEQATTIRDKTVEVWGNVSTKATEIWEDVKATVVEQVTLIRDEAARIWDDVSAKVTEIWDTIAAWVAEQAQAVYDKAVEWIQKLKDWWDPIWDGISTKITEIWESIVTWVTDQAQAIYDAVTGTIQDIKTEWERIWGLVLTFITENVQEIYNVITGKIEEVKTWISDQWQSLVTLGGDIIGGLVAGITGGAGKLLEALTGGVEKAVKGVKEFLGIESPSQLFAGFGEAMTTGLVEGLAEGTPELLKQQSDMIGDLVGAMGDELAEASKTLEGALEGINELLIDDMSPAFEELTEMLEDSTLPLFEETMELFEDDLVDAIEETTEALDRGFLDTAKDVLRWVKTQFIAGLEDLRDTLRIGVVQASYTVASVWTGTLIPAINWLAQTLESGARVQVDLLARAFGDLATSSQDTAVAFGSLVSSTGPVVTQFDVLIDRTGTVYHDSGLLIVRLDGLTAAFGRLRDAIQRVNDQLGIMIGRLNSLPPELPEYLQTRSMSPFEAAVRGISDAVHQLAWEELPGLISVLASPLLQGGLRATVNAMGGGAMAPAPVAAPAIYPSRNLSVGPVNITNGMDEARFMALFRRAIRSEMGGI